MEEITFFFFLPLHLLTCMDLKLSPNALGARAVPAMGSPMTPVWFFVSCLLMELQEISSRNNHIANTILPFLPHDHVYPVGQK